MGVHPGTGESTSRDQHHTAPAERATWGVVEVLAVIGLVFGPFVVPWLGQLFALAFVWASTQWTTREKTVASLVVGLSLVPVVLAVAALLAWVLGGGT